MQQTLRSEICGRTINRSPRVSTGSFTRVISDPPMGSGFVKEYVVRVMDFARAYGCESESSRQITMPDGEHLA
jgi:hypothetical protein